MTELLILYGAGAAVAFSRWWQESQGQQPFQSSDLVAVLLWPQTLWQLLNPSSGSSDDTADGAPPIDTSIPVREPGGGEAPIL